MGTELSVKEGALTVICMEIDNCLAVQDFLCVCSGILDQGEGVLILFDEQEEDDTYAAALDTIVNIGKVVDALYQKAKRLT